LAVLGFELRALCLLDRISTIWVNTPVLFSLDIFGIQCCIYPRAILDLNPTIYAFCIAGITGMHHHVQLYLLRWVLENFLPELALIFDSLNICFPIS
jgi:hypothetical protein